jgi:hypothetical protein
MKLPSLFYWIFGGVGFLLLTIAAVIFYFQERAALQYTQVEGTVIKNQYNNGMARPVIRYELGGKELLYADNTYTNPPVYERGEKIKIFVNAFDPKDVWIDTFMGRYFAITIVGGIGIFFLGFLALFHFAMGSKS